MITLRLLAAGVNWSAARVDLPVDAVRVEPAVGRLLGSQVDDVEHAAGGTAKGNTVAVGGHDIGPAVNSDALVIIARPVQAVRAAEIALACRARSRSNSTLRM